MLRVLNDIEAETKHQKRKHLKIILKKRAKLHSEQNGVVAVGKANFIFIHLFVAALTLTTAVCTLYPQPHTKPVLTYAHTHTHKTQMHPTFIMIFSKLIFLKSLFILQIFTRRKSSNRKYVAEKTDTKHPHTHT